MWSDTPAWVVMLCGVLVGASIVTVSIWVAGLNQRWNVDRRIEEEDRIRALIGEE